jgi:hypothetical protein
VSLTIQLKLDVRLQLEDYCRFHRRDFVFRNEAKRLWYYICYMEIMSGSSPKLIPLMLSRVCNKHTAFYFARLDNHKPGFQW